MIASNDRLLYEAARDGKLEELKELLYASVSGHSLVIEMR